MSSSRKQSRSSDEWKAYPAITEEPHICYCTKRGAPGQSHAYPQKGSNFGMRILHRFISRMHRPFTGLSFGIRAMSKSACRFENTSEGKSLEGRRLSADGCRTRSAPRVQPQALLLRNCYISLSLLHSCLPKEFSCSKQAFRCKKSHRWRFCAVMSRASSTP